MRTINKLAGWCRKSRRELRRGSVTSNTLLLSENTGDVDRCSLSHLLPFSVVELDWCRILDHTRKNGCWSSYVRAAPEERIEESDPSAVGSQHAEVSWKKTLLKRDCLKSTVHNGLHREKEQPRGHLAMILMFKINLWNARKKYLKTLTMNYSYGTRW